MIELSNNITLLRKKNNWSQTELAKRIGSSREIISKYEKENVIPSIEMAKKIADAFGVSLDYLVGEGQNASFDKKTVQRMQEIEGMDSDFKEKLLSIIDSVIRDYKTQKAYAPD